VNSISPLVKMRKTELSCCANYKGGGGGGEGDEANCSDLDGTHGWLHFVTIKLL